MIPIYYKSSEGVIVNLIETPYRMLTETDLLNSEWETTTVGENFPHISRLDKKLVSPKFKIRVTGSTKSEMANNLEHLESVFDRDCFLNQMGRLYIGEFYRECFITGITHGKVFEKSHTVAEFVATSNDGYWVANKEISFSGSGALVGEIADKVYVSANKKPTSIIYTPNDDHTAHLTWTNIGTSSGSDLTWIKFDFGSVTSIAEFSGLKFKRPDVQVPTTCTAQTSDGTTVDDTRTISASSLTPTSRISVNGFETLVIDDTGLTTDALIIVGQDENYQELNRFLVEEGEEVDVSPYRYIQFITQYAYEGETSTVTYTVQEEQWTTVETFSPPRDDEVEIVLTDLDCRYIRLTSSYFFNGFDEDLSVISDEPSSPRNILELGYQLENLTYGISQQNNTSVFMLNDAYSDGYMTFDDTDVVLKHIECVKVTGGASARVTVQGLNDGTWSNILVLENGDENVSEDYDTSYEQLRLKVGRNPVTARCGIQYFEIGIMADPKVYNESYAPSHAIIEISEMPNNPSVVINDVEYGADIELSQGHKLVIDTKKHTVRDYADEYSYENVYASRMADSFTQIETGENDVVWSGNANIKITLEQARSIPKWN